MNCRQIKILCINYNDNLYIILKLVYIKCNLVYTKSHIFMLLV